jgi:hypothetical protein
MVGSAMPRKITAKQKERCVEIYEALKSEASLDETTGKLLWSGKFTEFMHSKGLTGRQYTVVRDQLIHMACIHILNRGAGGSAGSWDTVIEILNHPNTIVWTDVAPPSHLTRAPDYAILRQELADIRRQLGGINLPEALRDIAQEMSELRKRLQTVETKLEQKES